MEREGELVNHRISWAIFLSAGILTTEGVLLSGAVSKFGLGNPSYLIEGSILGLMAILSCIALYFCLNTHEGVRAAHSQLDYLKEEYKGHKNDHQKNIFECNYGLPRPFGDPKDHLRGNIAAIIFPKMMIIIWFIFGSIQAVSAVVCLTFEYGSFFAQTVSMLPVTGSPQLSPMPPATTPSPPPPPQRPRKTQSRRH